MLVPGCVGLHFESMARPPLGISSSVFGLSWRQFSREKAEGPKGVYEELARFAAEEVSGVCIRRAADLLFVILAPEFIKFVASDALACCDLASAGYLRGRGSLVVHCAAETGA